MAKTITTEDMIKGDIAESLVAKLFSKVGIPYMRFGFEHQLLDFAKRSSSDGFQKNDVSERLRLSPDFLIRSKARELHLVEVKYWQQGRPPEEELNDLSLLGEYWSPKLVVVSYNTNPQYRVPHFQIVNPPYEIKEDRNFVNSYFLTEERSWGINQRIASDFCSLVEKLFAPFTNGTKALPNRERRFF